MPLEVAYRIARTYLLMRIHQEPQRAVDITKLYAIASKIANDLSSLRSIRTSLTSIGKTTDTIATDINSMERNIRDSLDELQDVLRKEGSAKKAETKKKT